MKEIIWIDRRNDISTEIKMNMMVNHDSKEKNLKIMIIHIY